MNVVIVGGGFCGAYIAKKIESQKNWTVTLIDKKDYFEYTPSVWKLLIRPTYHKRIIIPYSKVLRKSRIITDSHAKVTPEYVQTKKEKIPYDYLVISTGIDYPIFLKNKKNVFTVKSGEEVLRCGKDIPLAETILIIGGGLIGTEVASELATQIPNIKIILVHPHDRLIERNPKSASIYAKKFLEGRGVQIIFNQKIVDHQNHDFITDTKQHIKADLGIWCAGIQANPTFMTKFSPSILTEKNAIKVNQFLQLDSHPNIFVGGDISSTLEEKTAASADRQAQYIVSNLLRIHRKKTLLTYKPIEEPMIISLGQWNGLFVYSFIVFPGIIPAIIKFFVEKIGVKRL
jgi:NADH dehydrogenase FAD-containing subunit